MFQAFTIKSVSIQLLFGQTYCEKVQKCRLLIHFMEAREHSEPNSVLQSPEFEEIAQYVTAGTLTKAQFDILRLKICGATYEQIVAQKLASGPCALVERVSAFTGVQV